MGPCSCPRSPLAGRPRGCLAPRAAGTHLGDRGSAQGIRAGAAHAGLIPASTSPVLLIPLPHDKIALNPGRPEQCRAPKASRCSWQCQTEEGAGLSCRGSVGTWGSHREPGQGRHSCGRPLPLPVPPGLPSLPSVPPPAVLDVSCPERRMPQVTGRASLQPPRALWKCSVVPAWPCPVPSAVPAAPQVGLAARAGRWGAEAVQAQPPAAACCPFNGEP